MQQLESDLDVTQEKLLNANQKLEEDLESPRRGSSSPHTSSTRLQPPLTTTSVC